MKAKLKEAMKTAMKAKDKVRLETIRSVLSAFQYEEMQKGVEVLDDPSYLAIIKNYLKKRKESLEFSKQANREDEVEKLEIEAQILEEFLPSQLSSSELEKIIVQIKSEGATNLGEVMKKLKGQYDGSYDGKVASEIAKQVMG